MTSAGPAPSAPDPRNDVRKGHDAMNHDRVDALVGVFFVVTLVASLGMLLDIWQAVYYAVPALVAVFMLIGSLNARNEWSAHHLRPVLGFSVVLLALFLAAGLTLESSATWGGLPVSSAIFLYVMWPVTVVGAPLVYAYVYTGWLGREVDAGDGATEGAAS